jgi:hypothetical protein
VADLELHLFTDKELEDREDRPRCQATKRSGKRCKLYTIGNDMYCLVHGAANVLTAKANLTRLVNPAVLYLQEHLLSKDPPCSLCGHGMMTREKIKIVEMILDRGGLNAKLEMVHSGIVEVSHELLAKRMTDDELKIVDEIMERVMRRVSIEEGLVD